jgi:5-methyltetrahydrofolate--homocysteine methyltransferase
MEEVLDAIYDAIVEGDRNQVAKQVGAALEGGMDPETILRSAMIPAMEEVGRNYECGQFFVPEMLVSARAMKSGMEILRPHLVETGVDPIGRIVLATVKGDMHDIGKNLVGMMFEGAGFTVRDLGVDVSPQQIVHALESEATDVLAMSALLTTTMPNMKATIAAMEASGLREQTKVVIGGAPVTEAYADGIGADGFAPDASRAVTVVKKLLGLL